MFVDQILPIIISLLFSAFFSGMEISFLSANRVRLELDNQRGGLTTRIIQYFYNHQERFISTMLVGNNIALIVYGLFFAKLLNAPLSQYIWDNEAFVVLMQTILSTIVVLFTGEYIPKSIFKINPNVMLRAFALPLYCIYILLYPISSFATLLSHSILRLFRIKAQKDKKTALTKIDLDYFVQQGIDHVGNDEESEQELILFQNEYVSFTGMTVENIAYKNDEPGDDIYLTLGYNGASYDF